MNSNHAERIADKVYNARASLSMTTGMLAEKVGASSHTISDIESGKTRTLLPKTAVALSDALGLQELVAGMSPIRIARCRKKMSIRSASKLFGVSPSTMYKAETEAGSIHPNTIRQICSYFDLDVREVLYG